MTREVGHSSVSDDVELAVVGFDCALAEVEREASTGTLSRRGARLLDQLGPLFGS